MEFLGEEFRCSPGNAGWEQDSPRKILNKNSSIIRSSYMRGLGIWWKCYVGLRALRHGPFDLHGWHLAGNETSRGGGAGSGSTPSGSKSSNSSKT